jgi:hypothetical protein
MLFSVNQTDVTTLTRMKGCLSLHLFLFPELCHGEKLQIWGKKIFHSLSYICFSHNKIKDRKGIMLQFLYYEFSERLFPII